MEFGEYRFADDLRSGIGKICFRDICNDQRLILGNLKFSVQVRLLAMCSGELSAVIIRLMQGPQRMGSPGGHAPYPPPTTSLCLSNISVYGIFTNTALVATVPHLIPY